MGTVRIQIFFPLDHDGAKLIERRIAPVLTAADRPRAAGCYAACARGGPGDRNRVTAVRPKSPDYRLPSPI